MQISRDDLNRLLALNDRQLKTMIGRLAANSGIDPAELNIDTGSIESIRKALSSATDDDLRRVAEMYEKNQKHGR